MTFKGVSAYDIKKVKIKLKQKNKGGYWKEPNGLLPVRPWLNGLSKWGTINESSLYSNVQ